MLTPDPVLRPQARRLIRGNVEHARKYLTEVLDALAQDPSDDNLWDLHGRLDAAEGHIAAARDEINTEFTKATRAAARAADPEGSTTMTEITSRDVYAAIERGEAVQRFIVNSEAWYHPAAHTHWPDQRIVEEIGVGVDDRDGSTYGEWRAVWYQYDHRPPVLRHEVFAAAHVALRAVRDYWMDLLDLPETTTPSDYVMFLVEYGFTDTTQRSAP